ncbi:hypothetical protein NliqN6_6363 [Naganishia liquefaciens]|uniref:Aldehyde dehydrogenase domain-containing protein n=1 Tax=Naganishia liquefaciens TaxID=104408 RepID=A0A8H3TZV7_9TREE|nr:hypothetical protein NliqN6_6363 [Naganishia liquefaciens]
MPGTFEYDFSTTGGEFKGKSSFSTGLFINGEFVDAKSGKTIDVINPVNGEVVGKVSAGDKEDVDIAVKAAEKAHQTVWGENVSGQERGKILIKIAELIEEHADELAALETLDNGKAYSIARGFDILEAAATFRYYGGWADKDGGKVIDVNTSKLCYTVHQSIGVVGQIIPWNFPFLMMAWKLAPALCTGNCTVLKPSEFTPLTSLRICSILKDAGVPDGVVNIVQGLGQTVGAAISEHPEIRKVAFTGSGPVGRMVMKAAAASNLKTVTLELGGKSPNIIFEDADIEQAVRWAAFGIFLNHGQACCAGSRVFVHEKVYDQFKEKFLAHVKTLKVGNPFEADTFQGPQISQIQYDRIMGYIDAGKAEGATCELGGGRFGDQGYFIQPTVFSNTRPDMKIVKEEIFGPVVALIKFSSDEEVIKMANDTEYGLASAVFSRDISRALVTANKIHAGTVWVNCYNQLHNNVPFGGFKQSGIGRELGEYALANYTEVKSIHVNLTGPPPI